MTRIHDRPQRPQDPAAAAGTGPASWRFWIVRGADPWELAARADALLERER